MKKWLNDKWCWLKTFNKPPQIVIEGDMLAFLTEEGKSAESATLFYSKLREIVKTKL
jgi:hypothetical protein